MKTNNLSAVLSRQGYINKKHSILLTLPFNLTVSNYVGGYYRVALIDNFFPDFRTLDIFFPVSRAYANKNLMPVSFVYLSSNGYD